MVDFDLFNPAFKNVSFLVCNFDSPFVLVCQVFQRLDYRSDAFPNIVFERRPIHILLGVPVQNFKDILSELSDRWLFSWLIYGTHSLQRHKPVLEFLWFFLKAHLLLVI